MDNLPKIVRLEEISSINTAELSPTARDAYRLFQDLCTLLNDETPTWISGITHFSRPLGLELVEALISAYSVLFRQHTAFAYLLKTSLCPLVIKLFSPSLKLRSTPSGTSSRLTDVTSTVASTAVVQTSGVVSGSVTTVNPSSVASAVEKISFPIVVRLKRLITVIVEQYFHLLNTECEIYLSVLIRFLDVDKTAWQRALALEVLQKFSAQPDLIRRLCISYDMRQHSTKIFSELIGALSHYVQAVLANPSPGDELVKETNQSSVVTPVPGPNQSLLYYKGSFFPILQPKSFLVDLLDRSDAPNLQEGYCLSLAFGCLLRIVNSLDNAINHSAAEDIHSAINTNVVETNVQEQFIVLSWCGLLSAFALLLEASADEQITASLLQAIHTMIGLCGKLRVDAARDSFVTTLCKAALPSSYARSMFSAGQTKGLQSGSSTAHEEVFERSPVAIVVTQGAGHSIQVTAKPAYGSVMGTQPSTGSTVATSLTTTAESHSVSPGGSLLLTVKHLQAARSVLFAASVHGSVLGNSWNIILGTLQNLVWMLGLKIEPAAHLYFKPSNICVGSVIATSDVGQPPQAVLSAQGQQAGASVVPSPVLNDLTSLSAMLANLFAQSSNLDVAALNDLVLGLCHLSSEAIEAASVNKPPSHFPVAKLTEVGLVNIDRLNLWWDNVCCQLLTMCKLQNTDLRQLAANSLVSLIKQAIAAPQTPTFWKNETLTNVVLDPLSALSEVPFDDVREKQLECVQHMLHCWGEQIGTSWLRLIEIIGVIRDSSKVDLIQTAFQCFKLIVTDYMTSLLFNCYPACVETAARFGRQQQDLNIALTAIGTIVSSVGKLVVYARAVLFPLVSKVHELCANAPVEREGRQNSLLIHHSRDTAAKQWAETVVLTLSGVAHLFVSRQEQLVVLDEFPKVWLALLDQIKQHALTNSAEISVSALTALQILLDVQAIQMEQGLSYLWSPAWETWLQIGCQAIELHGLSPANGVQGTISNESEGQDDQSVVAKNDLGAKNTSSMLFLPTTSFMTLLFDLFPPLFCRTRAHFTESDFRRLDKIVRLGVLMPLHVSYLYPQSNFTLLPVIDDGVLSALQTSAIRSLELLIQTMQPSESELHSHLPSLLHLLLALAGYAVYVPKPDQCGPGRLEVIPLNYITFAEKCMQIAVDTYLAVNHWSSVGCKINMLGSIIKTLHKPMALKYACISQSTWLLASRCFFQVVVTAVPLITTEKCKKPATGLFKQQSNNADDEKQHDLCEAIAQTLQDFLFYQQQPPSALSVEEFQQHEELDCKFVNLISDLFLSSSVPLPEFFVNRLVNLLSLGSVQASIATPETDGLNFDSNHCFDLKNGMEPLELRRKQSQSSSGKSAGDTRRSKVLGMAVRQTELTGNGDLFTDGALNLELDLDRLRQYAFRENFARLCFSKLLSHAFSRTATGDEHSKTEELRLLTSNVSVAVSRVAVRSILQRCRSTLIQFYQSSQLTGKCPLPRARLVEVASVFKALTAMLTSLQSVSSQRDVDPSTWHHVIELYPHIVDCVLVTGGSQMTVALHRLLRLYGELLRPSNLPTPDSKTSNGI
ncbi:hypothetical protein PHET_00768 [Paragonimus heterotremus]|uniref:Protein MON2 homolog n=1 Tax=Paragonimus heterotremus TaxID=100268 RepID=A0A8J4TN51_9TREM|nr:hypothetical protein PHET_00768 [Paragonimus heterotremus]